MKTNDTNARLEIPPMPKPEDFRDLDGHFSMIAYAAALKAWERVAERLAQAYESASFWE